LVTNLWETKEKVANLHDVVFLIMMMLKLALRQQAAEKK
jgi:hypothetical protein